MFHLIDDDWGEFEQNLHEIYFREPQLRKENISPFEASFFNLEIKISYRKFKLRLYDNGDTFSLFE